MICSECKGEIIKVGNILKCSKCGREKTFKPQDKNIVNELDLNDKTKDLDILME
jgi:hypothetical protein